MNKKGTLIAVEGIDGSGKTTLINELKKYFKKNINKFSWDSVIFTKELGGTELGEEIRLLIVGDDFKNMDSKTHLFLSLSDINEHLTSLIIPHLKENKLIITDRFVASCYAYSSLHFDDVDSIVSTLPIFEPDFYFYLDTNLQKIKENQRKIGAGDRFDNASVEKKTSILKRYQKYKNRFTLKKWKTIDATKTTDHIFKQGVKQIENIDKSRNI